PARNADAASPCQAFQKVASSCAHPAAESVRGPSMAEFRKQAQPQVRWANQQQTVSSKIPVSSVAVAAGKTFALCARQGWQAPSPTFSGPREKTRPGWNPLNRLVLARLANSHLADPRIFSIPGPQIALDFRANWLRDRLRVCSGRAAFKDP